MTLARKVSIMTITSSSSRGRTPAVSPASPWLPPKFVNSQIVARTIKNKKSAESTQKHSIQLLSHPLKDGSFVRKEQVSAFLGLLTVHAGPVTKFGTHRSPPFLHCHLTTSKISSQRFRPICNTLVTNRRFCYSLT